MSDVREVHRPTRCSHHAAVASVATCDGCGEPLCIGCAVPVRGRVLGPGCLTDELHEDAPAPPAPRDTARGVVDALLAAALVGTALPWSGFGLGSGPMGAWGLDPRWSLVAAWIAAVTCATLAVARRSGRRASAPVDRAVLAGGVVVAAAAALALLLPPPFTSRSVGAWWTCAAAAAAVVVELRRRGETR